jgi:hypothetical protein
MKTRLITLLLLGILSGVLWRLEIEIRWGWAALTWISGFHYSSLLICLLFTAWLYYFAPCSPPNHALMRSVLALGGGMVSYFIYDFAFSLLYNRFPLPFIFYLIPFILVFIVIPLSICTLAWFFSPTFLKFNWLFVPLLFVVSFPFSSFLLWVTDHRGGTDPVHAVKSGFIFFGFLFATGFPFITTKKPNPY